MLGQDSRQQVVAARLGHVRQVGIERGQQSFEDVGIEAEGGQACSSLAAYKQFLVFHQPVGEISRYSTTRQAVGRMNDVAQEVDAATHRLQARGAFVEPQSQALVDEVLNGGFPAFQNAPVLMQQHGVIHVADVVPRLEFMLLTN